jgi:hypothetical protein
MQKLLSLILAVAFSAPLLAQCPLPADSPVLSSSVDDIPVTNDSIYTYPAGTTATARANHRVAFVQISSNEQRVYFAVDGGTVGSVGGIYYNRRTRADANSPWYWQFSRSPLLCGGTDFGFPGLVLYSDTPKYGPDYSSSYKFALLGAIQPTACNGVSGAGGFLTVTFSNDGISWTAPRIVQDFWGSQTFPCDPDAGVPVTAELVTGFDLGNGYVGLITMSGDNSRLAQLGTYGNNTEAYLWRVDGHNMVNGFPWSGTTPQGLSNAGLFLPQGTGSGCYPARTQTYGYFFNIDAAYDAAGGDIYVSRGYPFPFDRDYTGFSCQWVAPATPGASQTVDVVYNDHYIQGCKSSPATLPNRVQIYKMHIGALTNLNTLLTGTWSLVTDLGGSVGYENIFYNNGSNQALVAGQTNIGADWAALTFLRDATGNMLFNGNQYTVLGGDTFMKSKAVGQCRVTGLERVTQMTLTK